MLLWSAPDARRSVTFGLLGELGFDTAVRSVSDGLEGELPTEERMASVAAVNLGTRVEVVPRLGVAATLPVFLASVAGDLSGDEVDDGGGPTLGDLQLHAPLGLVLPDEGGEGPSVGLVPWVTLPTGNTERFLGDPGLGGGALVAGGFAAGRFRGDVNLGVGWSAVVERNAQRFGGVEVPVGAAVGVRLNERMWLGAEVRGLLDLGSGAVATPETLGSGFGVAGAPVEAFLTLRSGIHGTGPFAAAALGRGVTSGVGAANGRVFFGAGYASVEEPPSVPLRLRVADPSGVPVGGATVLNGAAVLGLTDGSGAADLADVRWSRGLVVRAPSLLDTTVPQPAEGIVEVDVVMGWQPATLDGRVVDQEGADVPVGVVATAEDGTVVTGVLGEVELPPGSHRVTLQAEGFGPQTRRVEVPRSGRPPEPLDVVLLPIEGSSSLVLDLQTPEGEPVAFARVLVDGRPVGATGTAGVLEVEGLSDEPHEVEVRHPDYTTAVVPQIRADGSAVPLVLARQPGSVRVTVRGPDDVVVPDAVARFVGQRRLAPMALGETGRRVTVLGPGSWTLVVSSESYGVQERAIEVPEDEYDLIDVLVVLRPPEQGLAALVVHVVDPSGQPVDGVEIALDGERLGETSTGGSVSLLGLSPGVRTLQVQRERTVAVPPRSVLLGAGTQEQTIRMEWLPGQVDVVVRSEGRAVSDAVARFLGPSSRTPLELGPLGRGQTELGAGDWTVLVTSESLGAQQRSLVVAPQSNVLHVVQFELLPSEQGSADLVVTVQDPEASPVHGAAVALDGVRLGSTSNTGSLELQKLRVGERVADVSHPLFLDERRGLTLQEGPQEETVGLQWATGAVRVSVVEGEEPVSDAIVRFLGPSRRPPVAADAEGTRLAQLDPGTWVVLATSPQRGVGESTVDIGDQPGLTDVRVELKPPPVGVATLFVEVEDRTGTAITGATMTVDGQPLGAPSGAGGRIAVDSLEAGSVSLRVGGEHFQDSGPIEVVLQEGFNTRRVTLDWVQTPLRVITRNADGQLLPARVQLRDGPEDREAFRTESDGNALVSVPPGSWRLYATAGSLSGEARKVIAPGDEATAVEVVLRESSAELRDQQIVIKQRIQFDFNKATLRPDSDGVLDEVADAILAEPLIVRVEVQGHTDNIGSVPVNQRLSQLRAQAVVEALRSRGVAPEKLYPVGYGRGRPRTSNDTTEGRAENRRVEFLITE